MTTRFLDAGKIPGELLDDLLSEHTVADPSVVVGPGVGFDAAAVDVGDSLLVVKTDPITFARERAPHYLVNVNANDLACMGATPRWLLVTALLPLGQTTADSVGDLFTELRSTCIARNISLIGGHTEIIEGLNRPILVGSLLGTASREELIQPGQARPGDRVLLTRPIAIEGTALLANELGEKLLGRLTADQLERCAALLDDPGISDSKRRGNAPADRWHLGASRSNRRRTGNGCSRARDGVEHGRDDQSLERSTLAGDGASRGCAWSRPTRDARIRQSTCRRACRSFRHGRACLPGRRHAICVDWEDHSPRQWIRSSLQR